MTRDSEDLGNKPSRFRVILSQKPVLHVGSDSWCGDQPSSDVPHRTFEDWLKQAPHLLDGHVAVLEAVTRGLHRLQRICVASEDVVRSGTAAGAPLGWPLSVVGDPEVMVTLLLYAYAVGERSSRAIERRCREDVAFRV